MKSLYFTRDWPVYFLKNGKNHMQLFWDGLDAVYLFVSFVQQSSVLEEQDPQKVTL